MLKKRITKLTLFVLAAGMGSRYGGLKQLDNLGSNGEIIMDYSIFGTIYGGFGKLAFAARRSFGRDFHEKIISKYENHIPVKVVLQDLNDSPEGFTCSEGREKPWRTNHTILIGEEVIDGPSAIINADGFCGCDNFAVLGKQLSGMDGERNDCCMAGYRIDNTLNESGSVAHGIHATNGEGYPTGVVGRTVIERIGGDIQFVDGNGKKVVLEGNTPIFMNMRGSTPDYLGYSEEYFRESLEADMGNLKNEYSIPLMVDKLTTEGTARVKVSDATPKWFGVTYVTGRRGIVGKIQALVGAGEHSSKLF